MIAVLKPKSSLGKARERHAMSGHDVTERHASAASQHRATQRRASQRRAMTGHDAKRLLATTSQSRIALDPRAIVAASANAQ
jgi:hypothetical protein